MRSALAAAVAAAVVLPAAAQDPQTLLAARRAAQALTQAAVALEEAEEAQDRVAALTQTVRAYEQGLAALREGLRQAVVREEALRAALEAKRGEIERLTGALAAIERMQDSGLLLHPDGPLQSLRAGLLIAAMSPALQAEAAALRAQFDEVALLRSLQEGSAATLAQGLAGAQEARVRLSRAIAERAPLPRRPAADPEALAALLAAADTLESFAAGLTAVPLAGPEPATPPFAAARGTLPLPVEATVLRRFRSPDAAGVARPGFVLAAAPQALVTAPSAATVRYAGPLLDYGNVIVLEPGAGYLLILAGLGQMFVAESEVVTAGAALGLVGGASPGASAPPGAVEQRGGGDRSETLYMEVREGGVPVDPETWFALERG